MNVLEYAVYILQDIAVPVTKNTIALGLEKLCARFISLEPLRVLAAIDFDDEARRVAGEIDDVASEPDLSPEV